MKHPGPWHEKCERLRGLGEHNLLGGPSLAAYTRNGELGLLTTDEYERCIAERERDRIVRTLREGIAQGEPLERLLDRLQIHPPRDA